MIYVVKVGIIRVREMEKLANQHDLTKDNVVRRRVVEELVTEGQPKAVAKFAMGFTVNLGNYESCKIDAGIELEGTIDNLAKLQNMAQEEVEKTLAEQLEQLQDKDTRLTILGFVGDRPAVKF